MGEDSQRVDHQGPQLEGIHSFDHHLHPEWTVKEADVLRFALSEKQLQAFLDWEVPDAPRGGGPRTGVKKARDLFCVQCTTGVQDLRSAADHPAVQ